MVHPYQLDDEFYDFDESEVDYWNVLPYFIQTQIIIYWIVNSIRPIVVRHCLSRGDQYVLYLKRTMMNNLYVKCRTKSMRCALCNAQKILTVFYSTISFSFYDSSITKYPLTMDYELFDYIVKNFD